MVTAAVEENEGSAAAGARATFCSRRFVCLRGEGLYWRRRLFTLEWAGGRRRRRRKCADVYAGIRTGLSVRVSPHVYCTGLHYTARISLGF